MHILYTTLFFHQEDANAVKAECHRLNLACSHISKAIRVKDLRTAHAIEGIVVKCGVRAVHQRQAVYSDADSRGAAACIFTPVNEFGISRADRQRMYDLTSGCARCGTGAKQSRGLHVSGRSLSRSGLSCAASVDGHLILREDIRSVLDSMFGARAYDAIDVFERGRRVAEYVQVCAVATLPPLDRVASGIVVEGQCGVCQRNGHYHSPALPFVPTMSVASEVSAFGIAGTHECWGASIREPNDLQVVRVAQPMIVVSRAIVGQLFEMVGDDAAFVPLFMKSDDSTETW